MSKYENNVDFWIEELTHDINPEHFNHSENFIPYMHDEKIGSFGDWMWNNGYNVGLYNLQAKLNTYCFPQWISIKDRLPEKDGFYLAYYTFEDGKHACDIFYYNCDSPISSTITHWMLLPEPPKEKQNETN